MRITGVKTGKIVTENPTFSKEYLMNIYKILKIINMVVDKLQEFCYH